MVTLYRTSLKVTCMCILDEVLNPLTYYWHSGTVGYSEEVFWVLFDTQEQTKTILSENLNKGKVRRSTIRKLGPMEVKELSSPVSRRRNNTTRGINRLRRSLLNELRLFGKVIIVRPGWGPGTLPLRLIDEFDSFNYGSLGIIY